MPAAALVFAQKVSKNKNIFVLVLVPALLIFFRLGEPQQWVYDEMFRITSAQKYLNGVFFLENHPPLGKLLIALGKYLYDPNTTPEYIAVDWIEQDLPMEFEVVGFRIAPALFGVFVPVLFYFLVIKITDNRKLGLAGALILAFDNLYLILSRIAILDIFLLFFILAALILFFDLYLHPEKGNLSKFLLLGALTACAMGVKDTGAILLLPIVLLLFRCKSISGSSIKTASYFIVSLITLVVIYLGIWQIHFSIARNMIDGHDYGVSSSYQSILGNNYSGNFFSRFYIQFSEAFAYHFNYNKTVAPLKLGDSDEIGSPWYYWPLGGKAINTRWFTSDYKHYSYIYLFGNPISWLFSLLGVILGTATVLADMFFHFLQQAEQKKILYILVFLYWAYMLPFWFVTRATYIHHYLPALVLGLLIMVLFLHLSSSNSGHMQYVLLTVVFITVAAFWYYKPFVYFEPLTEQQFQIRNLWPLWQLKCIGC
ncbi:MAG TPA: phospholipid carrier-dependent glycosyltransferase [Chitinispirillaceae bacterium]|nr:phospholipid carrier-dependent glycosyltransferase [Chitinispirillaceae bacterium]